MNLTEPSWLNLALQVPLAGIIVFLVIRFLRFTETLIEQFLNHLAIQRQLERDQIKEALGRLAEEIKSLNTDSIKELSQLVSKVDATIDKNKLLDRKEEKQRQ